jgi:pimeloyl-ACP methyl ester carboxylesterase
VWRPVIARLDRDDVVALALPGFGCAAPAGFVATKEAYVAWLLDALHRIDGPIDLVGHDWGAILVVRAVSLEPALVRTWASGGAPIDADYVWHELAQIWQMPGVGEQAMEAATPEALVEGLVAAGVPRDAACESARHVDAEMKRCILALYRSALRVGAEWQPDLARVTAPGLVLWGSEDPYAAAELGARLALNTKARFVSLAGCSHWWQLQRPDEVAHELRAHWASTG